MARFGRAGVAKGLSAIDTVYRTGRGVAAVTAIEPAERADRTGRPRSATG